MDIITYAKGHGVIIEQLVEDGRWHRVRTTDKPGKKNGAYMSRGTYGFVQNHATMIEADMWKPDATELAQVDHAAIARRAQEAANQIKADQEKAAKRAGWLLQQCQKTTHRYLQYKGFPDELGNVWFDEKNQVNKLCIPMFVDRRVVGLQTISDGEGFEKKFLYGQRTSEAVYVIDNKGLKVFTEGYATALSVRAALQALKVRYTLFVCFSAGNLKKIATNHGSGLVIADHDKPSELAPEYGGMGLKVAKDIGLPYWMAEEPGHDFNDFAKRAGLFKASQALKPFFTRTRA